MARIEDRDEEIVAVTIRVLESEGFDAVTTRRVVADASISFTTLYRLYGSVDELIIRAVETWMAANAYVDLGGDADFETVADALMAIVRRVYVRWEQQPHMLAAFVRARALPGGRRLDAQGFGAVLPMVEPYLASLDADLVTDLLLILEHVNLATLDRFAAGETTVAEILSTLDRTTRRVLGDDGRRPVVAGAAGGAGGRVFRRAASRR